MPQQDLARARQSPALPKRARRTPVVRSMALRNLPERALDAVPNMSIIGTVPRPRAAMVAPPRRGLPLPAAAMRGA